MKRIAVLTSGGDAPGMNAAIRAVVRSAVANGWEVYGVRNGYAGLIDNRIELLGPRDVGNIIQVGGTVLGSARSLEFKTVEGRQLALQNLTSRHITALVVIGGNGSQTGAHVLAQMGFPVVGVASTIDNDLFGSDITIGVDTALDVALEAIDRLKVTASSHHRAFIVEVMGRDCGYLALTVGLAGGAEVIVIPEVPTLPETVAAQLRGAAERGKTHGLVVVAEGAAYNAERLMNYFKNHPEQLGFDIRATILGHVQRGGIPGAFDRLLGTRLGAGAIDALARGEHGVLVGLQKSALATTPLAEVVANKKPIDLHLVELARILAQ